MNRTACCHGALPGYEVICLWLAASNDVRHEWSHSEMMGHKQERRTLEERKETQDLIETLGVI